MFWNKKKSDKHNKKGQSPKAKSVEGKRSDETGSCQGLAGDELRAQALANARAARENLGEDTIQRIAEIMKKKESSATQRAKAQIQKADTDRVVDGIRDILDEG